MARQNKKTNPETQEEVKKPASRKTEKGKTETPKATKTRTSPRPAAEPVVQAPQVPKKKTLLDEVAEERAVIAAAAKSRKRSSSAPAEVKPAADATAKDAETKRAPQKPTAAKKTASSKTKEATPKPVSEVAPPPVAEPAVHDTNRPQGHRHRSKRGARPSPAEEPRESARTIDPDSHTVEARIVPSWRKPDRSGADAAANEAPESTSPNLAPRRSRTRKRKDRKDVEISAAAALRPSRPQHEPRQRQPERERKEPEPAALSKPEPPPAEKPRREPVPMPPNAAQVISRNGLPVLVKGHNVLPPLFFFASADDETRLATVLEEAKMAADAGIHLFSFLVELEIEPRSVSDAVAFAGYMIKKISEVDPEAQFVLRTVFVAPTGWEKRYTAAVYLNEDGSLADPSVCDDEFWSVAEECLKQYIGMLRRIDRDERILGLHLERGEWFLADGAGFDTCESARKKFREWLQHRYGNDAVSLRAAWFDGNVDFTNVQIPEYREVRRSPEFVRTDRKARRWIDYHLFLSDTTCERIASLAYLTKRASEGHYLVGVSYGYTFEWAHPASGHLSLGKLLRSPDLDIIGGPPSYKNREPGGSAPFPAPIDSIALNGKLFLSEEDFKTPISGHREPDDFNPVMKTPQALGNVHWRGAGAALAHGSGTCWMDSWGNGWLNSRGIWERAGKIQEAMVWRIAAEEAAPDVAVFIDERSLGYLVDSRAFDALVQNVRESVLRAGLSAGFFLLSDLAHRETFPECKLHIFVNAWDVRPEVRSAIKTRLQRDGKVLFWLYCAGLFEGGRESLERVREVTGIALRPQPFSSKSGTSILNTREPLCQNLPEQALAKGGQIEPSYFAIPEDGVVLGEYSHSGLPSFVVRRFHQETSWHSVFLGEPIVTPGLIRSLGQLAGAHVWSFQNDIVSVKPPFLTVHCTGTSPRTLTLPDKWSAYNILEGEWDSTEGNSIRFQGLDGSTHSFLVGPRAAVEALLASDPAELLRVDELTPREENTVHWDMMQFDVAIMKLDEWVEESWGEDLADDLLLKPSLLEVGPEEAEPEDETVQRSRGRRRRRRRSFNEDGESRGREPQGDGTVNVMFRKRE